MKTEYLKPWKLATLALGTAALFVGSHIHPAPDWDYGISVVMAGATYLTAPWAVDQFWYRRWKWMPLAALAALCSVDSVYVLYWGIVNPEALVMRDAQFLPSFCFYLICGLIWRLK